MDQSDGAAQVGEDDLRLFCEWDDGMPYDILMSNLFSKHTYLRKKAIGCLVDFLNRRTSLATDNPHAFQDEIFGNQASLEPNARRVQKALQKLVENEVTFATTVQQLEFKGQKIVIELFYAFQTDPTRLLPSRDARRWGEAEGDADRQHRVICDHIAGMTDEYASKRYQQLFEPRVGSVFDRL